MSETSLLVRYKGLCDYLTTWDAMKAFTNKRTPDTQDEVWFLEHESVFTQGQNGKPEHLLNANNIPVIPIDRGGQITYHGPGQLMAYVLVDLRRNKFNVRQLVTALEQSIIDLLALHQIDAIAKCDAPGVYIDGKKICSIGLRIRKGCSYHGLALNVDMDLSPFKGINPCGFDNLQMTQLSDYPHSVSLFETAQQLIGPLSRNLGYTTHIVIDETHTSEL